MAGSPLVWRHKWDPERKEVVVHFKMSLTDTATFEKDEWGPWAEQLVSHNNPETGEIQLVKVLRTIPAGVLLMKSYPDIRISPGVTAWKEDSDWECERVFADLRRWQYHELSASDAAAAQSRWNSLHRWHQSHPTADTVTIGEPAVVGGDELRSPLLPWSEMWSLLKTYTDPTLTPAANVAAGAAPASAEAPAPAGGKRRVDRQALAASTSAAESNVVTHPGYSEADRRIALLGESGEQYLAKNMEVRGALFLIRLAHFEGELAVGLGRRSFDDSHDREGVEVAIEWFERKNKTRSDWGVRPSFRLAITSYNEKRRPVYATSVEKLSEFLPITVKNTGSKAEPTLSSDCLTALRTYLKLQVEEESSEEEVRIRKGKIRRKALVPDDE